jgi:DNA-binding transcriptional MerR regulator
MREMDIGEVARRSGVPASALRFYEQKGLIATQGRRGLRRQYPETVLDRLSMIVLGRVAGFSLDEIGLMFATDGIDRRMLAAKADELDKTIRRMIAMRNGLRHAAVCPAPSHSECSTFKRLLKAASAGRLGAPEGKARRRSK